MTVIIAYADREHNKCYIGGDFCVSFGSFRVNSNTTKVFHYNERFDIVIGCSGSVRMGNLVYTDKDMFPEDMSSSQFDFNYIVKNVSPILKSYSDSLYASDNQWELVIAIKDKLYLIQGDCSVLEMYDENNLITLGCGCETAWGAMKSLLFMYDYANKRGFDFRMSISELIVKALNISLKYNQGVDETTRVLHT